MATKRSAPKKPLPAATARAASDKMPAATVIRRNGGVTLPVEPAPTSVEMRAEREPAVSVAPTVLEAVETDEWAPAPAQLGWWERIRAMVMPAREPKTEMAEHLAAVKAGVLQELETLGVKKGVAVKGSPFSTVLLPVAKKKTTWKWWLVGALALVILAVMVWVGRKPEAPDAVLAQALSAVRGHDVRTFEAKVDVASVATSVVNQMFNVPQQGDAAMAAKMTAFVKPGLADGLKDQILAAVSGEVPADGEDTLLGKLWQVLGAGNLRVGTPRVAMQDQRMAVAELPLMREDLGLNLPLQVVLTHNPEGAWQVVDMPNLGAITATVAEAERVLVLRRAQAAAAEATATPVAVKVDSIKKAKGASVSGSSNLIVSMVLSNDGTAPAKDVVIEVAFGDAAGQPMMTTRLTMDGTLAAGTKREQVWSVPVDRSKASERYVADLPLTALTVTATIVK